MAFILINSPEGWTALPFGMITLWNDAISNIPYGWSNFPGGGRFIFGANAESEINTDGGGTYNLTLNAPVNVGGHDGTGTPGQDSERYAGAFDIFGQPQFVRGGHTIADVNVDGSLTGITYPPFRAYPLIKSSGIIRYFPQGAIVMSVAALTDPNLTRILNADDGRLLIGRGADPANTPGDGGSMTLGNIAVNIAAPHGVNHHHHTSTRRLACCRHSGDRPYNTGAHTHSANIALSYADRPANIQVRYYEVTGPNFAGEIGMIIMRDEGGDLPTGWARCDGQDGRPDFREKSPRYNTDANAGQTFGTAGQFANLTGSGTTDQAGGHRHRHPTQTNHDSRPYGNYHINVKGEHEHNITATGRANVFWKKLDFVIYTG